MDFLIFLPVLLMSVVVHEVAHAQVAKWEGDETAARQGRITLNPIPHLDLMGSIIVPLLLFFLPGNFLFGWAKPVPVNPRNYRDPRWGDIRVSLAGVTANLILAIFCLLVLALILKLNAWMPGSMMVWDIIGRAASFGLYLNLILAVFNLIPLPPLDGSHVVYHFLPPDLGVRYREVGRYGIGILMLLVFLFPGAIRFLLLPVDLLMQAAERFLSLWI
ncbi:MAG: site-2 protease family protein [Gemmatimonadota bacterium]